VYLNNLDMADTRNPWSRGGAAIVHDCASGARAISHALIDPVTAALNGSAHR